MTASGAAVPASLGSAVLKLRLDLSFGDPVDPQRIDYPTLLDDPVFSLLGYPLESVIAEKAETMMALGDANSRDRDYGDIYVLSGIYPLEREPVWEALLAVAQHRGREVRPLGPLLKTLRESRQQPWAAFRARVGLPGLPERFSDVVDGVVEFIDGSPAREARPGARVEGVPAAAAFGLVLARLLGIIDVLAGFPVVPQSAVLLLDLVNHVIGQECAQLLVKLDNQ